MNKLSKILYILCILSVIILFAAFYFHERPSVSEYQTSQKSTYSKVCDYTYTSTEDSSAPVGVTQEYSFTLTDIPRANGVVLFYLSHQEAEVMLGDKLVYCAKINNENFFSKGIGFGVARIPIYPEDEGKILSIKIRPVYKASVGKKLSIYCGNYDKIVLDTIQSDAPIMITCSLCVFIGLIMLIISFYKFIRKKSNFETGCMSIFAIFTGLWKLADVNATTFFISNPLLMSAISIMSIPIMSISFVFYLRYQFPQSKQKFWTITGSVCSVLTLTIIGLQIARVADIRQSLIVSHIMIAFVITFGMINIIKELRTGIASHKLKAIFICVLVCMAGTAVDMVTYYFTNRSSDTIMGIFAFFVYIMYMGLLSLHEAISLINQGRFAKHYEQLALHDELTGLNSRVFFKQYIAENQTVSDSCHLVMFDVNNLKQCNDTRGHACGDMLLRNAAELIQVAFLPDGKCIRLSGDEFCVLLENTEEEHVKKSLSVFSNSTKEYNKTHPDNFPIRVAYGYAHFDHSLDLDLNDTLKRADKRMYEMKHQMKQQANG